MYIFQDHLQTNFEMFYFLGEGLCSLCTGLEVAGDAHSHISFTLFPFIFFILTFSLLLSLFILFVLIFLFQAQALLIWLSLNVSSPSLDFLKGSAQLGRVTLADASSPSNIIWAVICWATLPWNILSWGVWKTKTKSPRHLLNIKAEAHREHWPSIKHSQAHSS